MILKFLAVSTYIVGPLGRALDRMRLATDLKFQGLWMGPAPKLLSQAELLAGDVIFCGGSDTKMGRIIRAASAGQYTHCALYVGAGKVVDVDLKGCKQKLLNDLLAKHSYLAVTRCPGNEEDVSRRRKLVRYAYEASRTRVRGYNRLGAALAPFRELADLKRAQRYLGLTEQARRPPPSARSMFCSEFIIDAFMSIGYIPINDKFLGVRRKTPSGLAAENIFELVGFMSREGLSEVSRDDPHLAGCGWVLTEEGQKILIDQEQDFEEFIQTHSISADN